MEKAVAAVEEVAAAMKEKEVATMEGQNQRGAEEGRRRTTRKRQTTKASL